MDSRAPAFYFTALAQLDLEHHATNVGVGSSNLSGGAKVIWGISANGNTTGLHLVVRSSILLSSTKFFIKETSMKRAKR